MRSVAILGAGAVGASVARSLAEREVVSRIVLVDSAAEVAKGKALDIAQSGPIDAWDVRLGGSAQLDESLRPAVVIVADRHGPDGDWTGDAALELLRRAPIGSSCPVLFACPSQHTVMAAAVRELGLRSNRLAGTAPEALASSAAALTALAGGVSPSDVVVPVVGLPAHFVVAWNESRIGGAAAPERLPSHVLARLGGQILGSWPPGPYALGSAAAAIVAGMLKGSPRRRTVFAVLEGQGERRGAVAAIPATLAPFGIAALHPPALSPVEQLAFGGLL
jgi:malate dehydrogenase